MPRYLSRPPNREPAWHNMVDKLKKIWMEGALVDWDEAKAFTRAVAEFMVSTFGDRFTATVSKARRKGKIFIDYLRNAQGATAIAPYCVRARAGAPVAMPIGWDDLGKDVRFDHYNVKNAAAFLGERISLPTLGALALTSIGVVMVIHGTAPAGLLGLLTAGGWQLVGLLSAVLSGAAVATIRQVRKTDGSHRIDVRLRD